MEAIVTDVAALRSCCLRYRRGRCNDGWQSLAARYASATKPKQNGEFPAWIANGTTEKATAGKVTDDKKSQTEGKSDKAKGFAHNAAGDIDAMKQSNK